jgi:hypothetical protein
MKYLSLILLFLIAINGLIYSQNNSDSVFIYEDFDDKDSWEVLTFPKIKSHSHYEIVKFPDRSVLKTISDSSASGLVFQKIFNVNKYPIVEWKWKVSNIFEKGDAKSKQGDDYPLRVYIIFEYNPEEAGIFEKAKYNAAKLIYGEYPPHSSLNYIWANKTHQDRIITNTYTSKAKMIVLREGGNHAGKWVKEKINILQDYQEAFGEKPPGQASLAIMSDSDNTGESAEAFIDFIRVSEK